MKSEVEREPFVVLIILNWNNSADTIDCIESVSRIAYSNYRIVVVDNASEDDSIEQIRAAHPSVDLLELQKNWGYAEGNNIGTKYALELGAEYVFVLNNDTLLAPDMLSELIRVAESRPEIGMVGPKMYSIDPPDTLFSLGSFILWEKGDLLHRGLFEPAGKYQDIVDPEPVDFIVGCGVLVKRSLIEKVGGFNPDYYLNYEDVEWGLRAKRMGFEVWVVPKAVMWHKVSASLGLASPANTYYMTRNALIFFWRNAPRRSRFLSITSILARTVRTVGAWTLKEKYRTPIFRRKRNANLYALRDFFLGRFGEMGPEVAKVCYGG